MAIATNIPAPPEFAATTVAADPREFRAKMGSISRQSSTYFAGTVLTAAAGYFFKIYIARKLGAEALGLYALGMTLVGFLGLFNSLGLPSAAARFVAQYSATQKFELLGGFLRGSLALLSACNVFLGAAVLIVGPWIAVHFYHSPRLVPCLWAFALIMLLGVLTTFMGQVMAGYQDVARRTLITHFIGTPTTIICAVILISLGFGLQGYLAAQVASAFLVLVLLALSVWKMTPVKARSVAPAIRVEREVVAFSTVALGIAALEFVLSQADKIVLGYYLDARQVGIYAVAMALVGFVPIALQSVNQIFSPMIAELHATSDRVLLQQLFATLTRWIFIWTFPLALTIVVFSRPLMGIFGRNFESGAAVLAVGAVGQLFNCAVGSVGFLLLMSGLQMQSMKIEAVSATIMIVLTLVLVPRFGLIGAAIATATGVVITNAWSLVVVRRRLGLFPYHSGYFKLIAPALVSTVAVFALSRSSMAMTSRWEVAIAAMVCAYVSFISMVLVWSLDNYDRLFATMIWAKAGRILGQMEMKSRG
jgi:O-antigen/teichoic acid export membrane protein